MCRAAAGEALNPHTDFLGFAALLEDVLRAPIQCHKKCVLVNGLKNSSSSMAISRPPLMRRRLDPIPKTIYQIDARICGVVFPEICTITLYILDHRPQDNLQIKISSW